MKYWKYVFLLLVLALLAGCSGKETEKLVEAIPLTEAEITQVNEAFAPVREENGVVSATEVSCFFTSCYDRVEELDFGSFMKYFPGAGRVEDDTEFAALAALPDFPWKALFDDGQPVSETALPVPTHKIPEEAVNAALTKWAGITLEDVADKSEVLYLEDHHAFYTFTSDFGPGCFTCTEGEVEGDTARLWSEPYGEGKSRDLLTMKQKDGNWYICSFQTVPSAAEE